MKLIIGSKTVSTWSIRPWMVMKYFKLPFEEILIPLDQMYTGTEIAKYSKAGRVPILIDGDVKVWDSLAICEYLAETVGTEKNLWPADRQQRAWARSICAEMHSGFTAMREHLSAEFLKEGLPYPKNEAVLKDLARVKAIWTECIGHPARNAKSWGPFLFGDFSIADAFFAPVVSRFRTYSVEMDPTCAAYAEAIWTLPVFQEWLEGARKEV